MDKNPKRRKYRDNPYFIEKDSETNRYVVTFKDYSGTKHVIDVTEEVWNVFNEYELNDLSEMNEYDNNIEHSEIYEDSLVTRAKDKEINMEDEFIRQSTFDEVKRAVDLLPEIQRRRIKKYYFEDMNEYEIAAEEGTTHQAIDYSLKFARENLKNILKIF